MATIKDVAKAAGVSIATVSRVINNVGRVSDATRRQVNKAIRELGYSANEAGRALKTNTTNRIAVILPSMVDTFYTSIIAGIQNEAESAGYFVTYFTSNHEPETEKAMVDLSISQSVDGIILFSCVKNDESAKPYIAHLEELNSRGKRIPVVTMAYRFNSAAMDAVSFNYEGMAYEAVRHLIGLSRRRIVFLARPESNQIFELQMAGYRRALGEAGIPFDEKLVIPVRKAVELYGFEALNEFLDQGIAFDAVYASCDQLAVGAMKCLKENKIAIPRQVAVFGTEDHFVCTLISPQLSSVSVHKKLCGELAVQRLIARMGQQTPTPMIEVVPGFEIMARGSSDPDLPPDQRFFEW